MQLKDQAAIVTGGASGLGAATARRLAAQGAKVAVCDLNAKLAETVAAEIGGTAVICDVSDAASAEEAIAKAAAAHGPARVLVNCAGIGVAKRVIGKEGPMALGDFDKVIKVNLIGSFNMLRLAAAGMSKLEPLETGERGVVISTASVAAYDGQIGQSAYSASKGGIVAMTLPIARELAQFGIRVLTIAPGLFLTPLLANLPQEAQDSLAAAYRSSGAIATPRTSSITRAILRCSMIRPRSCSRRPDFPSRTSSSAMAWSAFPWWTQGRSSTSRPPMATGSQSRAASRVSNV